MSESNWGVGLKAGLAIVLGLLILFFSYQQLESASSSQEKIAGIAQQQSKINAEQASRDGEACADIVAPVERQDCATDAARETDKAEREIRDLEAQQTMALWTRYMGLAAIIGTTVGIIGVALIAATLQETRAMAMAAQDALNTERRREKVSNEPNLVPILSEFRIYPNPREQIFGIRNDGPTKASDMSVVLDVEIFDGEKQISGVPDVVITNARTFALPRRESPPVKYNFDGSGLFASMALTNEADRFRCQAQVLLDYSTEYGDKISATFRFSGKAHFAHIGTADSRIEFHMTMLDAETERGKLEN